MMIRERRVSKVRRGELYSDTLCHFNPNHDPRNGQFAKSATGNVIVVQNTKEKKKRDKLRKLAQESNKYYEMSRVAGVGKIWEEALGNKTKSKQWAKQEIKDFKTAEKLRKKVEKGNEWLSKHGFPPTIVYIKATNGGYAVAELTHE